jgi:hypothetical protein
MYKIMTEALNSTQMITGLGYTEETQVWELKHEYTSKET